MFGRSFNVNPLKVSMLALVPKSFPSNGVTHSVYLAHVGISTTLVWLINIFLNITQPVHIK